MGHTGLNTLLKYLTPLLISLTLCMEPVVGSIIGAIFGVQGVPGALTWIGGLVMLAATCLVVYYSDVKHRSTAPPPPVELQMKEVFGAENTTFRRKVHTVRKPDGHRLGTEKRKKSQFELQVRHVDCTHTYKR